MNKNLISSPCNYMLFYLPVYAILSYRSEQRTDFIHLQQKCLEQRMLFLYESEMATHFYSMSLILIELRYVYFTILTDPSFFVHRVGRTARAGRSGGALMFITEDERSYVTFLFGRGVPLKEKNKV